MTIDRSNETAPSRRVIRHRPSGPDLSPEEVASMVPYEREQGGWWEYGKGCDVYGTGKVWRAVPAEGGAA